MCSREESVSGHLWELTKIVVLTQVHSVELVGQDSC
jgi:hypothetical protein